MVCLREQYKNIIIGINVIVHRTEVKNTALTPHSNTQTQSTAKTYCIKHNHNVHTDANTHALTLTITHYTTSHTKEVLRKQSESMVKLNGSAS